MDKRENQPLQEELRSSQVYRTLKSSGIPMAGKLAEGLGKAAQGLDQALNLGKNGGPGPGGHPYQAPPPQGVGQAPQPGPRAGQTQQTRQAGHQAPPQGSAPPQNGAKQANGYYRYTYTQGKPVAPPPSQQAKAQRAAAAQRTAAAQHAAANQAAAAQRAAANRARQAPWQGAPVPQGAGQPPMKMVRKGSPAKFYITGGVALFYALSFPLYEPYHFIVFAVVLVLVFLASGALFKGKKMFVPVEPEKPKEEPKKEPEKPEKSHTGDPEVDKIIDEGREYLKKLRAADDAIPDETLSEDITRMERASADIFRYIADHPEKAQQIRKFMNYYLPTTMKLLNSYQRLSAQNVKGENITSTLFNIAGMMHTVADAFEKQLDSLYAEEAMDISADITVFETLLKQEGFVEEEKQEEAKK